MTVTTRAAVLLLTGPPATGACPPGVSPAEFARALAEDVVDRLTGLPGVDTLLAVAPARRPDADAVGWPGTVRLDLAAGAGPVAVLAAAAGRGYAEAAVLAPDAPDLPDLLVAKPFSGLAGAEVAALPAAGGGLVGLASRLPVPAWLAGADVSLDEPDAVGRLRAAAPGRSELVLTPGWHRLRTPDDLRLLDPDLEGWDVTRALLSGQRGRSG